MNLVQLFEVLATSEDIQVGKLRLSSPLSESSRISRNTDSKECAFETGMAKLTREATFSSAHLEQLSLKYGSLRYSLRRRTWYLNLTFAQNSERVLDFDEFWKEVHLWRYSSIRVFTLDKLTLLLDFGYYRFQNSQTVMGEDSHIILTRSDDQKLYISCNQFIARRCEPIEYPTTACLEAAV